MAQGTSEQKLAEWMRKLGPRLINLSAAICRDRHWPSRVWRCPLRAPWQTSLVAHRICTMRAATNTPAEPQDAFLVSSPATAAFPVVEAGRLLQLRFQGLLGVHCALRPAWPADSPKEPFLEVLQSKSLRH